MLLGAPGLTTRSKRLLEAGFFVGSQGRHFQVSQDQKHWTMKESLSYLVTYHQTTKSHMEYLKWTQKLHDLDGCSMI